MNCLRCVHSYIQGIKDIFFPCFLHHTTQAIKLNFSCKWYNNFSKPHKTTEKPEYK